MKFKNIKKNPPTELPSNSRTITEPFKLSFPKIAPKTFLEVYRYSLWAFVVLIFLLALVVVGVDLQKNLQAKESVDIQRTDITKQLKFWDEFIDNHKDSRDAYFQAAILEYRLGNTSKANILVEKGLSLDPNSEDGRKLKKFLK